MGLRSTVFRICREFLEVIAAFVAGVVSGNRRHDAERSDAQALGFAELHPLNRAGLSTTSPLFHSAKFSADHNPAPTGSLAGRLRVFLSNEPCVRATRFAGRFLFQSSFCSHHEFSFFAISLEPPRFAQSFG